MIKEPRSEFVGRGRELEAIATLLGASRLVTLAGVGGAGKTRLAIRAANAYAEQEDVATWFVSLDSVHDARRIPLAVARALPLGEQSARDPLELIVDVLGDSPALVVLDNCEHLIDAAASFVDELLDAVPRLTVIATSRRRLELDGEQVFSVPPLDVDAPNADQPSEAVTLLIARARAADASFELEPHQLAAATELCRALDGLPLAIELAASRLQTLSLEELSSRLSSRFTLLRGGSRSAVARQRTLRAVVDWSHELCTPDQRTLWAALSVFSGPFDLASAVAVAGGAESTVVDLLGDLVAQSVVEADRDTGRFHLLETIRGYGRERAEESGLWPQSVGRHLDHYSRLAADAHARWYGPDQAELLATQRADRAELHAALGAAMAVDTGTALTFFSDLRYHWGVGGFLPEGRSWATRLLALPGARPEERAPALITAAWLCLLQGDLVEARGHLTEVRALHATLPPELAIVIEIELHRWSGTRDLFAGDPARAREQFRQSIQLAYDAGRPEEALLAQFQLTVASSHLDLPDAASSARDALRCSEAIGERWMRSLALWSLALAAFVEQSFDEAESRARAALTAETGIDDPVGDCLMLEVLSWVDAARSPTDLSAILLGAARSRWRRIGSDIAVHGPQMAAHHERCVETVREHLGERAFARLTASGERLSPSEAASFTVGSSQRATGLSERETEVATGIHEGLSNREIAERLVLSVRTVDTHVQRILAKLGFVSRAQVAAWFESTIAIR